MKARSQRRRVRAGGARRTRAGTDRCWHLSRRLTLEPLEQRALLDAAGDAFPGAPPPTWAPGELLVRLREPAATPVALAQISAAAFGGEARVAASGSASPDNSLGAVLAACGAESIEPVFPSLLQTVQVASAAAASGGSTSAASADADRARLARWFHVALSQDADAEAAAEALRASPEVEIAEPNYEWGAFDYHFDPPIEGLPNGITDPAFGEQWFHPAIKGQKAWNYLKQNGVYPGGNRDVVVAVIDSGVDAAHEELAGNMWVNSDEIPGNNVDDDHNGYKDDVHGASVVGSTASHSGDSSDQHGHGTHVAGIVAAQAFNGAGGCGVAFSTQIMAVRAAQYSGTLTVQDISEGILYAVDNGAEVINMSFGGYIYSQLVDDALEMALNQAVLVAAAGNDGAPYPAYPARLPYVISVGASTVDGDRAWFSNAGLVLAPGEDIFSTLPGDGYAPWSGTSMAAPVVSGIAGLMRSYFWQRDIYSSRFIMGSIVQSGGGGVVDAYRALTEPPTPGVSLYENWLFDDELVAEGNDDDGRPDAGETLHIGVELINRSGQANNVVGTLRAYVEGAVMDDPYITIDVDTVSFGSMGPWNMTDNGFIYGPQGEILAVWDPFVFTVDPSCPNDHVIPFELTLTFTDGWNPNSPVYTRISRFEYIVQRGRNVPKVISQDTTLTADDYWIVGSSVLVEPGATLRIGPGTQVQWGGISDDPYNPGPQSGSILVRGAMIAQGTAERPIEFFPSYLVSGQLTTITAEGSGIVDLSYTKIRNPYLTGMRNIDHCYIDRDTNNSWVRASGTISNTILHRLTGGELKAWTYDRVLFDAESMTPTFTAAPKVTDSVFLQDNQNNVTTGFYLPVTTQPGQIGGWRAGTFGNTTYALLTQPNVNWYTHWVSLQIAELVANYFGGHVVSVNDSTEQQTLSSWISSLGFSAGNGFAIGLTDEGHPGIYTWLDGSSVTYTNWKPGYPVAHDPRARQIVDAAGAWQNVSEWDGMPYPHFILELPGVCTVDDLNAATQSGVLLRYVREHYRGDIRYNAFLSKYWDPNVGHWMRLTAQGDATTYNAAYDNYWGITSTELIDHAIVDYYDNFTSGHVDYQPPPDYGFESTFPFVQGVTIDGYPVEWVPTLSTGPAEFAITFNRDMDTTVQPFVAYGPSAPHTDFSVKPIGLSSAEFVVALSAPCSQTVTVAYATENGTAVAGFDYEETRGTLTFAPGATQQTVRVPILGDTVREGSMGFSLRLSQPTVVAVIDGQAQATVVDDDPQLSISDASVLEGDAGTSSAVFTVTLSAPCDEQVTVQYATENGSAKSRAEAEYQAVDGELVFAPGQTQKTIAVPVIGDNRNEPDEQFYVKLTHPTRASIADNTGTGTILDDDLLLSIATADPRLNEGDEGTSSMVFQVSLSAIPRKIVTVDFTTADRIAVAGEDFQATSGTLRFEPGQGAQKTFEVTVMGDTIEEPNEDFVAVLLNASGAAITASEARGIIVADDGLLLSVGDVTVAEGDGGQMFWSATLGGTSADEGASVAIDAQGNIWVTGQTTSAGWVSGGFDITYNGGPKDAFVAKISPEGQVLWSSFLGGTETDAATGIAVDPSGNAWVIGSTNSAGWTMRGFDTIHNGNYDAFIAKFSSEGTLVWSSYLGGIQNDYGYAIATDAAGDAWVTGTTSSSSGWVSGGFDTSYGGGDSDAFAAKFTGDGALLWSSYLGGANYDGGAGITVDDAGNAWVTGSTWWANWVSGGFDTSHNGSYDAFLVKFNSAGQHLWSTFWGAPDYTGNPDAEFGYDVAVDASGDAWVVGESNFYGGYYDVFVLKISTNGQQLLSSRYLTRTGTPTSGRSIAIDGSGNIYVTGYTESPGWMSGGFDQTHGGSRDGFVAKLASDGQRRLWSSYLGSSAYDYASGIAVDSFGNAWVVGSTDATSWLGDHLGIGSAGSREAFLAKVGDEGINVALFEVNLSGNPGQAVTVNYATSDGTAKAGQDYQARNGSIVFQPGLPLQQTVAVDLLGDEMVELDEDFYLRLSGQVGAIVPRDQGKAVIANDDPSATIQDVALAEGSGGTISAILMVTLWPAPLSTVAIDYSAANGTATGGADYQAVSGTLTFQPGQTQQTIVVPVIGDLLDENEESFTVKLSNAKGAAISRTEATVTITDDDPFLSVEGVNVAEGHSATTGAVFNVRLSANPLEKVYVDYATADGTAVAGQDYQTVRGRLVFWPGDPLVQTVTVPVIGETLHEEDEQFQLALSNVVNGFIAQATAQGTVLNDDDPRITIDDVAIVEGDSGTKDAVFTVRLSANPPDTVTVNCATADGLATAGVDYTSVSGTLTFEPGQPLEQTIVVQLNGDTDNEDNESFFINLSGAVHATLADNQGLGTIVGDDGPLVSIADTEVWEGDVGTVDVTFTVGLSAPISQNVLVNYTTVAGTATSGTDYDTVTGTLLFRPGQAMQQTIYASVFGDTAHESNETYFVRITSATGAGVSDDLATCTIKDDDAFFTIDDPAIVEGESGVVDVTFTVTLSQPLPIEATVDYATADGTAVHGVDFLTRTGRLTFLPGETQQTIAVHVLGDIVNETDETFPVNLSAAVEATIGDAQGQAKILDDDGPKLTIDPPPVTEGDSGTVDLVFTVSLTAAAGETVTVQYATANGTATAGLDYQARNGTLTFQPGETEKIVLVPIIGDTIDELDETVLVNLTDSTGVPILIGQETGVILDDDTATISISDASALEGFDGWINNRTWVGSQWITPVTGEGYHCMRISGAAAADDPWLVSGYDVGRFRFQVHTMGVAAMTLQATGQEGSIRLT